MLFLPGAALLAWLPADSHSSQNAYLDPLSGLADSSALSVAISTLLALALFFLKLRLSPLLVIGLYGFCLLALLAGIFSQRRKEFSRQALVWQVGAGLLALLFLGVLVAWRLYQARSLALPAWVDSVHHTLIVRMIADYGGIPWDFSPYLPAAFFYHYGFHLMDALFAGWSGLPPDQAVLWFGQVLNAAVALSVYRAGRAFGLRRAAQLFYPRQRLLWSTAFPLLSALLVTFTLQMPAYYLTWGRYTLLTGLLLLGPAMAAALEAWANPARKAAWVQLVLLTAGLALSHYFALIIAGLFVGVVWLFGLLCSLRRRGEWLFLLRLAGFTALGGLLAAPWLVRAMLLSHQQQLLEVVTPLDANTTVKAGLDYLNYLVFLIGPRRNHILMGIAGVGLLAAFWRSALRPLAVWSLLMALFSLPWGLHFGPFRPDYFAIILFFPAALLIAALIVECVLALGSRFRSWMSLPAFALVTALFVVWGVKETQSIINPVTVIADAADVKALDWVKQNTPGDARFYINSTLWMGQTYRGVDGGYWLLPYTGRFSLVPPALYDWGSAAYTAQIRSWADQAGKIQGCTPAFWTLVREANLNYVYLRQGRGSLQPANLADCPRLLQVYAAHGVTIYQILTP